MGWKKFYPWLDFAPQKFCANLSTLFFLGSLKAPGTWGSAAGLVFSYLALRNLSCFAYLLVSALMIYAAIGVCEIAEKFFEQKDPGKINLDEFVALPLCFFGIFCGGFAPETPWIWALLGFGLFRFFDIAKPFGIKRIQSLEGGLGCVMDDIAAAFAVCLILNVLKNFANF